MLAFVIFIELIKKKVRPCTDSSFGEDGSSMSMLTLLGLGQAGKFNKAHCQVQKKLWCKQFQELKKYDQLTSPTSSLYARERVYIFISCKTQLWSSLPTSWPKNRKKKMKQAAAAKPPPPHTPAYPSMECPRVDHLTHPGTPHTHVFARTPLVYTGISNWLK